MKLLTSLFAGATLFVIGCGTESSTTSSEPSLKLLAPSTAKTYKVGDTVHISIEYKNPPSGSRFISLWCSNNNGVGYDLPVLGNRNTLLFETDRVDTVWTIPADSTIFGSYIGAQVKILIHDYTSKDEIRAESKVPFTIVGP